MLHQKKGMFRKTVVRIGTNSNSDTRLWCRTHPLSQLHTVYMSSRFINAIWIILWTGLFDETYGDLVLLKFVHSLSAIGSLLPKEKTRVIRNDLTDRIGIYTTRGRWPKYLKKPRHILPRLLTQIPTSVCSLFNFMHDCILFALFCSAIIPWRNEVVCK
jgi:hypothetical protein